MSHKVRDHTRRVNGKTVTVRQHQRDSDGMSEQDHNRRDAFERRVLREQQALGRGQPLPGGQQPGEKRRRKKNGWSRAKGHAKKARRLWRRHKVRATAHGLAALGWAAGHATRRGASKARKTWQQWRKRRKKT